MFRRQGRLVDASTETAGAAGSAPSTSSAGSAQVLPAQTCPVTQSRAVTHASRHSPSTPQTILTGQSTFVVQPRSSSI